MSYFETTISTYLLIGIDQATSYGRETLHPTIGICATYIISAERTPLIWAMYPPRRNYSCSLIAIDTIIHANPSHWVCQACREIRKDNAKTVRSTTKMHASLLVSSILGTNNTYRTQHKASPLLYCIVP